VRDFYVVDWGGVVRGVDGLHLGRRGKRVLAGGALGGGNARASRRGNRRISRMGYGADELIRGGRIVAGAVERIFFARRANCFTDGSFCG